MVKTPKGNLPPLLQLYLSGRVTAESLVILDAIDTAFINKWLVQYDADPLVRSKVFSLTKYKAFCQYDACKIIPIFNERLETNETH